MPMEQSSVMQATGKSIRVVLADDHWLFRLGLRVLLQANLDVEIVGEAVDGEEALRLVGGLRPDVLVLDMSMPGVPGDEVARRLRAAEPCVRILALSAYADDQYVFGAVDSGVKGYILKDDTSTDLVAAVRGLAHDEGGWFSRPVMAKLAQRRQARRQPAELECDRLTPRERDVLRLVALGRLNGEIAEELCLELKTVRNNLDRIFGKLHVHARSGAVVRAFQLGLVQPSDLGRPGGEDP